MLKYIPMITAAQHTMKNIVPPTPHFFFCAGAIIITSFQSSFRFGIIKFQRNAFEVLRCCNIREYSLQFSDIFSGIDQ